MSTAPAPLVDIDGVRPGVDAALAQHVESLRHELGHMGSDPGLLLESVTTMVDGGKRLRAAFCYWSWAGHGGPGLARDRPGRAADRAQVLRVGAALELFQAAALFHDDVMDDSDTRRGRPAAHRELEALHRRRSWVGSSRRFGESGAILLGDLALIASEREFTAATDPLSHETRLPARTIFDRMRTEVTVGQYLDVLGQALPWGDDVDGDEQRARAVARSKSARYSVEHPLSLGAALAGADEGALARCRRVGLPLGEAFQLRDDLLGVFGDPAVTGKPAGDDLREGKRTVLVARTLRGATPAQAQVVHDLLGRPDLDEDDVGRLREIMVSTGAVDQVEDLIEQLAGPALDTLRAGDLLDPARQVLVDLGVAAVRRRT
ncbi:polyprenyl synthetase family protein [Cellulomonas bogoriensis]|uniref:Polyprenyl synthetase n=1 Tax=Cellulomonas bogoriensis 69B4 = DSM 16987 TaxID=1386082 RepID=A0A0A0BXQ4_9CELL|nr:polyprenyl synthetase family protein [Cellulomonas bogoriensis]KGM13173.1 polyprenyl synthetase [Cellulomonas bogoriensis 69B4 = DSM 16987]